MKQEKMYIVHVNKHKKLLLPQFDSFEYASKGYKIQEVKE